MPFERRDRVRLGFVGVGGRGRGLLADFVATGFVDVIAIADRSAAATERTQALLAKRGAAPAEVSLSWEALVARRDLDLVVVATPWDSHATIALAALAAGHPVALEVPAAVTVDECHALVHASVRYGQHCTLLENCCYGETEMTVRNMVRAGLFGTLTHGEAAYIHDLRDILFAGNGEGLWRRGEHFHRDGNLYPTHGLGPVAQYMEIGVTDDFDTIVSVSSREAGLTEWRDRHHADTNPYQSETYRCGDMNTSIIKTVRGRTIVLQHDIVTPRPYDRRNLIAGTRGAFCDYPPRLFLDGQTGHDWQPLADELRETYRDPLWQRAGEQAINGGHGGMDFVMAYRFIECFRQGLPPDIGVYDAARWSIVGPLSEESVRGGGVPVRFPDWTRTGERV